MIVNWKEFLGEKKKKRKKPRHDFSKNIQLFVLRIKLVNLVCMKSVCIKALRIKQQNLILVFAGCFIWDILEANVGK